MYVFIYIYIYVCVSVCVSCPPSLKPTFLVPALESKPRRLFSISAPTPPTSVRSGYASFPCSLLLFQPTPTFRSFTPVREGDQGDHEALQGSESHAPNPGSRQTATNHRAKMWPAIPSDSRTTTAAVSRQVRRKRIYPWMAIVTLAAAARHLRTRARSTASESLAARLELSSYLVAVPLERGWKRWTWQIHSRTRTMFYTVFYTFVVISFQVAIFTGESCVQLCCPWRSLKSIS